MVRVVVDSPMMAKAFGNALAFMPARSLVKYGLIIIRQGTVYTAGTDGYAAGTDQAPVSDSNLGSLSEFAFLVDKDGMTALDKAARESKKTPGSLTVEADNSLTFHGEGGPVTVETFIDERTEELYDTLTEIIEKTEGRPPVIPGVLCLDPGLWSKFAKVKADNTSRKADLLMSDSYEPVLIKIGPTFKGLLMPVDREVHGKNVGEDGLW